MKVGQLFDLPSEISYNIGATGNIRNKEETKLLAKYEVVEIEGERKGKVTVVYKQEGRYKCKPKS